MHSSSGTSIVNSVIMSGMFSTINSKISLEKEESKAPSLIITKKKSTFSKMKQTEQGLSVEKLEENSSEILKLKEESLSKTNENAFLTALDTFNSKFYKILTKNHFYDSKLKSNTSL